MVKKPRLLYCKLTDVSVPFAVWVAECLDIVSIYPTYNSIILLSYSRGCGHRQLILKFNSWAVEIRDSLRQNLEFRQ